MKYNGQPLDANHLPTELSATDEVRRTVGQFNGKIGFPIVKIDGKISEQSAPAAPVKPVTPTAQPKTVEATVGGAPEFHLAIATTTIGKQTKTDVQAFDKSGKDPHSYPLKFDKPSLLDARPQINGNALHRDAAGHLQQDTAHPLSPNSLTALDKFTANVPVIANGNVTLTDGHVNALAGPTGTGVISIRVNASEAQAKLAELKTGHFTNGNDTKINFDPSKISVVLVDENGKNLFARASTGKEYKYDEAGKQPAEVGLVVSSSPQAGKVEGKRGDTYQLRDSGGVLELVTNGGGRGFEAAGLVLTGSSETVSFTIQHNDTLFIDALKKPSSFAFPEGAKIDLNVYDKDGKKIDSSAYKAVISNLTPVGKGLIITPNEAVVASAKVQPEKTATTTMPPASAEVQAVDPAIVKLRQAVAEFKVLIAQDAPDFIAQYSVHKNGAGQSFTALDTSSKKDKWSAEDISAAKENIDHMRHSMEYMLSRTGKEQNNSPATINLLNHIKDKGLLNRFDDAANAVKPSKYSSMNVDKKEPETLVADAKDKKPNELAFNPISSLDGKDHIALAIAAAIKGLPQPENKQPSFLADNGGAQQRTDQAPKSEPIGAKKGGEISFTA